MWFGRAGLEDRCPPVGRRSRRQDRQGLRERCDPEEEYRFRQECPENKDCLMTFSTFYPLQKHYHFRCTN